MQLRFKTVPDGAIVKFPYSGGFRVGKKDKFVIVEYSNPTEKSSESKFEGYKSHSLFMLGAYDIVNVPTRSVELGKLKPGDMFFWAEDVLPEPYTYTGRGAGESLIDGKVSHFTEDVVVGVVTFKYRLMQFEKLTYGATFRYKGMICKKMSEVKFTYLSDRGTKVIGAAELRDIVAALY